MSEQKVRQPDLHFEYIHSAILRNHRKTSKLSRAETLALDHNPSPKGLVCLALWL
jgi:hypothetical protein